MKTLDVRIRPPIKNRSLASAAITVELEGHKFVFAGWTIRSDANGRVYVWPPSHPIHAKGAKPLFENTIEFDPSILRNLGNEILEKFESCSERFALQCAAEMRDTR